MGDGFTAGPMAGANKNKGFTAGPMQPATEYERTGKYPGGTSRRSPSKTTDVETSSPNNQNIPRPPPLPSDQNIYDLGYVKDRNPLKDDIGIITPPEEKELSLSEFKSDIYQTEYDINKARETFISEGQKAIDFNPDEPVFINGESVKGKDVLYTVTDFQPFYLYGHERSGDKGSTKTLSAESYDIYMENLGKSWMQQGESVNVSEYDKIKKDVQNWHPDTKIYKSDEGYRFEFPYAGAEKYGQYKKSLDKSGFLGLFATALTGSDPLGIPSAYYMATGNRQKAIDKKIQAIHSTKEGFVPFAFKMPTTQIGIAAVGGQAFGAGTTYTTGYLTGRYGATSTAMSLFKGSQLLAGGTMAAITGKSVYETFEKQGVGEGLGMVATMSLAVAAGYKGYKSGQSMKLGKVGFMRRGFQRGFEKRLISDIQSGRISGEQGLNVLRSSQLEYDLRKGLGNVAVDQGSLKWENIQTLQDKPDMIKFMQRHTLRRKSEVFGSFTEGRSEVHDLDVMYSRLFRGKREISFASDFLGYGDDVSYMDIKPMQKGIVGRAGTVKQPSYEFPGGYKGMRWSESAMRHGESSFELAHSGRVKDIPRAVELYTKLFESAGTPDELSGTITEYTTVMKQLEQKPLIMSSSESSKVYGPSLGQRWMKFKTNVYKKVLPESIRLNKELRSFQKTYDPTGMEWIKKSDIKIMSESKMPDMYGRTYTFNKFGVAKKLRHHSILNKKPKIEISTVAFDEKQAMKTLYHEAQHQLHPDAPEFMIHGVYVGKHKIFPGAEDIPRQDLLDWVQSRSSVLRRKYVKEVSGLPPAPSSAYISSITLPSISISSSLSPFISSIVSSSDKKSVSTRKRPRSYTYKKTGYSPSIPSKSVSSYLYKPSIPSLSKSIKKSSSSYSVSKSLFSSSLSKSVSSFSTSASISKSSMFPSSIVIPSAFYKPQSLYGRGKKIKKPSLVNELYKFRGFDLPNPLAKKTKRKKGKGLVL